MSFANLSYDPCAYNKTLEESLAVGKYLLDKEATTPSLNAFPTSPYVRLDKSGVATCATMPMIDVDSRLMGLGRTASKCPSSQFDDCKTTPLPDWSADFLSPEETKMSNPPCTLRGTGWNRWEWLCTDPQEKAIVGFETNIQNKLVVRDNHRPCVPKPVSQESVLPGNSHDECYTDLQVAQMYNHGEPAQPPLMHWRKCCEIGML